MDVYLHLHTHIHSHILSHSEPHLELLVAPAGAEEWEVSHNVHPAAFTEIHTLIPI